MHMSPVVNVSSPPTARAQETGPASAELASSAKLAEPAGQPKKPVDKVSDAQQPEQLDKALENINKNMTALGQNLEFSVDPESKRTVIKVIDQRTQEVIRQMPSAEALEISKALDRVQGLLIRQQA